MPDANIWMPVGLSTGYALHDLDPNDIPNGALLGPEVSLVRITNDVVWYGGYVDFLWDFGSDRQRLSVGPEFGYSVLGIDGGYVLEQGDKLRHGLAVRPLLTLGVFGIGLRTVKVFGDGGETLAEINVLVKLPFPVANTHEHDPTPDPKLD